LYQGALPIRSLASNERGICYAEVREFKLEVWELMESAHDQIEWTLAHEADLKEYDRTMHYLRKETSMQPRMQWAVVEGSKNLISLFKHNSDDESDDDCDDETPDGDYEEGESEEEKDDNYVDVEEQEQEEQDYADETRGEEEEEQGEEEEDQSSCHDDEIEELGSSDGSDNSFNSDQHNFIDFDSSAIPEQQFWGWGCSIVGFHPYKDVLLLKFSDTIVAYHLHTFRMQYLGNIYPHDPNQQPRDIHAAFPYRPSYVDALPCRTTTSSS
jgi:hypothetical protein